MTTMYFVRHAEPNYDHHDDRTRELSPKGMEDRHLIPHLLADVPVDAVLSSPFKRAMDTVQPLADSRRLSIRTVEDFRERCIADVWIPDFNAFSRAQWTDFDFKLTNGESLREVQARNITALQDVLLEYAEQTVVIGSHGTALSTIINHYVPAFGHADFERFRYLMPWVVRFTFNGLLCQEVLSFHVFNGTQERIL